MCVVTSVHLRCIDRYTHVPSQLVCYFTSPQTVCITCTRSGHEVNLITLSPVAGCLFADSMITQFSMACTAGAIYGYRDLGGDECCSPPYTSFGQEDVTRHGDTGNMEPDALREILRVESSCVGLPSLSTVGACSRPAANHMLQAKVDTSVGALCNVE